MGKFDLYKIPLKTMALGTHQYEFHLDNVFFKNIDGTEFQKGDVKVLLTVTKTALTHEFNFKFEGVVQVPCDRCLDDMDQLISTQSRLFVKLGKEYSEESDEIVIIPEDEGEINLAWFLYEFIALAIPMKHIHAPGKCNKTMSSKLHKHAAKSNSDDEESAFDNDADLIEEETDDDVPTDPRWDELKKLIDNN
ncbi:MAG: YceD family protein [Bacteroidales bacterium]